MTHSLRGRPVEIGSQPPAILTVEQQQELNRPHFLRAAFAPGHGMNMLQLRAWIPGLGETDVIAAPPLPEAKRLLEEDNELENQGFLFGSGFLLPWANRIRGTLLGDGKNIATAILGRRVVLPARWAGPKPHAEKHAIHGLMLGSQFEEVKVTQKNGSSQVNAFLRAGDFAGCWFSSTEVSISGTLSAAALELGVIASNVGEELLPMGIGFHPYFSIPSGNRQQVRLKLPSVTRVEVDNYDDVFPTGRLLDVAGTRYDFHQGRALGDDYIDDCFTCLRRDPSGHASVELADPAANYRIRLTTLTPSIRAFQIFARIDKNFVAVEPQFNLSDPFNPVWKGIDTGIAMLEPGESAEWRIRIEIDSVNG